MLYRKSISFILLGIVVGTSVQANPTPPKEITDSFKVVDSSQELETFGYSLSALPQGSGYTESQINLVGYVVSDVWDYGDEVAPETQSPSDSQKQTSNQPPQYSAIEVTAINEAFSVGWQQESLASQMTDSEQIMEDAAQSLQSEINLSRSSESVDLVIEKWQSLEPKLKSVIAKERELNELLDYFNRLKQVQQNR